MKKATTHLFIAVTAIIFGMTSCGLQKRHYTKGWHLEKSGSAISGPGKENKPASIDVKHTKQEALQIARVEQTLSAPSKHPVAMISPVKARALTHAYVPLTVKHKKPLIQPIQKMATAFFATDQKYHPAAIAALVLGILALITYYGALLMAILAIIFGVRAMKRIKADSSTYKGLGMAKTGMILGIIGCALFLLLILLI